MSFNELRGDAKCVSSRLGLMNWSEVFLRQASSFSDPDEHLRANFFTVVKSENNIRPTFALEDHMRTSLSFDTPANPKQRREDSSGFG